MLITCPNSLTASRNFTVDLSRLDNRWLHGSTDDRLVLSGFNNREFCKKNIDTASAQRTTNARGRRGMSVISRIVMALDGVRTNDIIYFRDIQLQKAEVPAGPTPVECQTILHESRTSQNQPQRTWPSRDASDSALAYTADFVRLTNYYIKSNQIKYIWQHYYYYYY